MGGLESLFELNEQVIKIEIVMRMISILATAFLLRRVLDTSGFG